MIKAVLFDLDGTFADTAPDLAAALNHVRIMQKLPELALETVRPQASHGSAGLLKLGFGVEAGAPEFDTLRDALLAYYSAHICQQTALFAGMEQLIDTIEQRGLPWGIVTNKPKRFTEPLMQALGCAKRAACIISGDSYNNAKPHPEPMFKASEIMGVAPEHCIYLGDDIRDMQAARAAGMRAIIASYGYISPTANLHTWLADGSINSPPELLKYI